MSSKTIAIIALAVIVIGGGYMLLQSKDSAPVVTNTDTETQTETETNTQEEETATPTSKKMAFSEFLKQGGAHKCTVNQNIQDMETKGTTYISGDMIRGEYAMNIQGMDMTSTFIVRDGYTYTWSSIMPNMGFKSKIVETTPTTNPNQGTSGSYSWNADLIGDYNCETWRADSSLFEIPTGITFTETN